MDSDISSDQPLDARRSNILEAAMRTLARNGIQKTTMEQIAKEASVSRVTIYREFGTRQALIEALVVYRLERFHDTFFNATPEETPFKKLLEAYLMTSARVVRSNQITRRLTGGSMVFVRQGSPIREAFEKRWQPILSAARASSELAPHVSSDEFIAWILTLQYAFSRLANDAALDEPTLERMMRAFVLPAFSLQADSNSKQPR